MRYISFLAALCLLGNAPAWGRAFKQTPGSRVAASERLKEIRQTGKPKPPPLTPQEMAIIQAEDKAIREKAEAEQKAREQGEDEPAQE